MLSAAKAVLLVGCALGALPAASATEPTLPARPERLPNIVLILADDLGVAELGVYGQEKIRTPNIDRLASEGMRFTQAYAPSPVCAPTRCMLLTGLHSGRAYIRDNMELRPDAGQLPIPESTVTIAKLLKKAGYATACVGKWGLGPVGSSGDPNRQGFDFFFGYNCQRVAHNLYADHLWRNSERIELPGNSTSLQHYTPDLMADEAIGWMRQHHDQPFFLYFATPLPHLALQAPPDAVAEYRKQFTDDPPYDGSRGYLPCATPRATYAAMVTRVDDHVGRIISELRSLGVDENTLVVFTSDNGPTFRIGGADSDFFNSTGGLRGRKRDLYEGGIRVPLIARWPGRIQTGTTSPHLTALYDLFPTFLELARQPPAAAGEIDGLSLAATLTGSAQQREHDYLYWEFPSAGGKRALRKGDWKLVLTGLKKDPDAAAQLYNLASDPTESNDVATDHPELVAELLCLLRHSRTRAVQKAWNF